MKQISLQSTDRNNYLFVVQDTFLGMPVLSSISLSQAELIEFKNKAEKALNQNQYLFEFGGDLKENIGDQYMLVFDFEWFSPIMFRSMEKMIEFIGRHFNNEGKTSVALEIVDRRYHEAFVPKNTSRQRLMDILHHAFKLDYYFKDRSFPYHIKPEDYIRSNNLRDKSLNDKINSI